MNDRTLRLGFAVLCLSLSSAACSEDKDDGEGGTGGQAAAAGASSGKGGGSTGGSASGGDAGKGGSSAGAGGSQAGSSGKGGRGGTSAGAGSGGSGDTGGTGGTGGSSGTGGSNAGGEAGSGEPTPPSAWVNATGNLAGMQSECGNLTLVSAKPGSGTIIAGVAKVGLFASDDAGKTWSPLGTGAGSAVITNRPSAIVYDPEDPNIFWESGIYNGGGLYKTTDGGETFEQLGELSHNDLVSIDFSDPDRQTLLVGGHEQKQTLYLSTNGGETFEPIGSNLPAGSHFSSEPLVLDAQTFLVGACGYGDGQCGVFRSEDGGESWDMASDLAVQAHPLWALDGSIYWTTQYDSGIARGTDDGTSWSKVADNIVTANPIELPDGRVVALRGEHVVVSGDQGVTWTNIGDPLPFKASGVAYSVEKKTLFAWHWDCGEVVLDDAIVSAGFDYTAE